MSSIYLNNIKPNHDTYGFDKISCLEKPIGIVLNNYKKDLGSIYYLMLSMLKSYNTDEVYSDTLMACGMQPVIQLLKYEFNITMHTENTVDDYEIANAIINQLDIGRPVFLLGNLRELYYTKFYKSSDWEHLFIIKGYDSDKQIFYCLDCSHIYSEDALYKDFCIEFTTVQALYKSYYENYGVREFYYFDADFVIDANSNEKILNRCIDIFSHSLDYQEMPFNESKLIEDFYNDTKDKQYLAKSLMKSIKAKQVFIEELNRFFVSEELEQTSSLIIEKWKNLTNCLLVNFYRGNSYDVQHEIKEIAKLEYKLKSLITQKKKSSGEKYNDYQWIYENNHNAIISRKSDGIFDFNFNDNKTYNTWNNDDSPKIFIKGLEGYGRQYKLTTKVIEYDNKHLSQFMAGIVLKTSNQRIFFFGSCSGQFIKLDEAGVSTELLCAEQRNESVYLQVTVLEKIIVFRYSYDGSTYIKLGEMNMAHAVKQAGIACKTWESGGNIIVRMESPTICKEQSNEVES